MNWFDEHKDGFFKLNIIILALLTVYLVWGIYQLGGLPNNNITQWTPRQWDFIRLLWVPSGIQVVIQLVGIVLFIKRKYIAFPLLIISFIYSMNNAIWNIHRVLTHGFIYPVDNIWGILECLEFILTVIGTVLWIREIRRSGKRWWFV